MRDNAMTTGSTTQATGAEPALVCHWVSVTDTSGRKHMEARWSAHQVATHATHAA